MISRALSLRLARSGDARTVQGISRAAYARHVATIGRTPVPMMIDYTGPIRDGEVWIAQSGEMPVACLVLEWRVDALYVDSIAVIPDRARQGIGGQLMSFVERRAREEGRSLITLHTNVLMTDNRAWYRRLGFVETGTEQTHPDRTLVHLEKRLDPDKNGS